ncbi:hypothetical protein [Pseudanabaena cinerea]|uniref:hypothetical protein n=1 Tax=Pseudanabaena cinerea TaxID=2661616 RepID=UPI001F54F57D|nr:hypothetical protein [Pseudanabaena cinerea]
MKEADCACKEVITCLTTSISLICLFSDIARTITAPVSWVKADTVLVKFCLEVSLIGHSTSDAFAIHRQPFLAIFTPFVKQFDYWLDLYSLNDTAEG